MSFTKDMGPDCFDEEDFDPIHGLEQGWKDGIHRTQKLEEIPLYQMQTPHLVFTIRYFSKIANVSPLLKELYNRKIEYLFSEKELTIPPFKGSCLRCGEHASTEDQLCSKCLSLFTYKAVKIWNANTSPDRYISPVWQLKALEKKFYLVKTIGINFAKYKYI